MTSRKIWCKLQNGQLAPKSPIFKMVKNYHGAYFHMWDQNSNVYNLCIVEKEIVLRSGVQNWTCFDILLRETKRTFF